MALRTLSVTLAAALGACASASESATAPWVDARGLEFVSREAFCRYHCSATHVARAYRHLQERSECTVDKCPQDAREWQRRLAEQEQHSRSYSFTVGQEADAGCEGSKTGDNNGNAGVRAAGRDDSASGSLGYSLDDGKNVERVDFVTCQSLSDASEMRRGVSLTVGDPARSAFTGFHDAFFQAYDAMVSGADATTDACKLQFVQDELLSNFSTAAPASNATQKLKPMLVKLDPDENELKCLDAVREIWTTEDEGLTPFLTQNGLGGANATVMLIHINQTVGEKLADLDCILGVVELPPVLKLTPFARASVSLARSSSAQASGGPSLEIRIVKGSSAAAVATRLQSELRRVTGLQNSLSYREEDPSTRVIEMEAMDDFTTWTKSVAVILEDDAVEWVDLKTTIATGALGPGESFEQRLMVHGVFGGARMLRDGDVSSERRLDAYVQDLVGATPVRAQNITGSGIVVGVTDTGLYVYHDQFDQTSRDIYDQTNLNARKVVLYKAFGNKVDESEQVVCGHGTHVSGILAGSSYSKRTTDLGIAHSARIAFMDIGKQSPTCAGQSGCEVKLETPGEVDALMSDQVKAGARIFSFSWGTGGNDYNIQSRDLDNYVYNNPEVLIIVAAGNSGDKGSQTISSPSGAKNVISVGASLNDAASFVKTPCSSVLNKQTVASFSSIGPTLDGRLKPDLVAPGMTIESSQSEAPGSTVQSSALCSLQGTSQATPVVAGMAVLLYEWLRDGWWKHGVKDAAYGMKTIPAALLKALILHSGEKMTRRLVAPRNGVTSCVAMEAAAKPLTSYPDFHQGYGKPTMSNLVSFVDDQGAGVYFFPNSTEGSEPRVTEGAQAKFTFVLKERANLRVTLVWTDPAGSVGGKQALQNDLDLSVRIPNSDKVFYPLSGNGTRDSVNNVEMVEVSYNDIIEELTAQNVKFDESAGVTVEAVVYGRSVKAGARTGQPFALVASSSPSSVETASASSDANDSFWQPWMTVGVIVAGTLLVLFAIAIGWRMKVARDSDLKAAVPPASAPHSRPTSNDAMYHVHGGAQALPPVPSLTHNRPNRAPSNSRLAQHRR